MTAGARLYEPAEAPGPLWRVDEARTLFVGPLDRNAAHEHGAPVFLSSLDAPFGLKLGDGPWFACEAAIIPAGCVHELDIGGEPIAVLYVEPTAAGAEAFLPLLRGAEARDGAVVGRSGCKRLMREFHEDPASALWAGTALDDMIGFGAARAPRDLDPRVALTARAIERSEDALSLAEVARMADLSASRLQHLFTEDVGVSFRRYRAWTRMRRAIREIVAGENFTRAAHAAGFCDQPHFAHDFRRTFGAPASRSLTGVRR